MPALLLLRCDINKLRADRLSMEQPARWAALATTLGFAGHTASVDVTNRQHLLDQLSALAQDRRTLDLVVIVAHGNERGIKIASDCFASWGACAEYLKPFAPRRIVLIACKGGRYDGVNALFGRLPNLRRIFASPLNIGRDPASVLLFLAPYLVANAAPPERLVRGFQMLTLAVTKCLVWQWMRTRDMNNPNGRAFDAFGDLLNHAME